MQSLGTPAAGTNVVEDFMLNFINDYDASREDNFTLTKLCFATPTQGIWKERKRMFQKIVQPWWTVLRKILVQIRSRALFLNLKISYYYAAAWNIFSIPKGTTEGDELLRASLWSRYMKT